MTNTSTAGDFRSMHERLDWMAGAGFKYLSTESGTSEVTHPSDTYMLSLLNETTRYAGAVGMPAYVKVHCSSGQVCKDYVDPRTGAPLNFNFLPIFANESLGLMPHPVQVCAGGVMPGCGPSTLRGGTCTDAVLARIQSCSVSAPSSR